MTKTRPEHDLVNAILLCYNPYDDLLANKEAALKPSRETAAASLFEREGAAAMQPWAEKFYNSDAWRSCRDSFLQSRDYLCERCSTPDDPIPAKVAHHRRYLTKANINDPNVSLSWANLEALCQKCHNEEHHKNDRRLYRFDDEGNIQPSPPIRPKYSTNGTPRRRG